MSLEKFDPLYQRAAQRKGDTEPDHLVAQLSDDLILSAFTKKG
jgi:hypothetical protein